MSEEQGWWMIVTEMGIDTRTPMGKVMAHMAVVFAKLSATSSARTFSGKAARLLNRLDRATGSGTRRAG